jgi:hypothetical protein
MKDDSVMRHGGPGNEKTWHPGKGNSVLDVQATIPAITHNTVFLPNYSSRHTNISIHTTALQNLTTRFAGIYGDV